MKKTGKERRKQVMNEKKTGLEWKHIPEKQSFQERKITSDIIISSQAGINVLQND